MRITYKKVFTVEENEKETQVSKGTCKLTGGSI